MKSSLSLAQRVERLVLLLATILVVLWSSWALVDSLVSLTQHYREHKPVQYSPFLFLLLLIQPLMTRWMTLGEKGSSSK